MLRIILRTGDMDEDTFKRYLKLCIILVLVHACEKMIFQRD